MGKSHLGDVEKLRRHQQILADLGRIATQRTALEALLGEAARYVARAVEINHVKIMRYRPEQGDLLAIAGLGWKPGVIGSAAFPLDLASAPGRAFRTAEPVVISNIHETEEFRPSAVILEHGIVSLLNVPIALDGAAWGVLEVDATEERDFSTDTVTFMQGAAHILGGAIARDRIERSLAEAAAEAAAQRQQTDLLMSEAQHRVKNYFQMILAMLTVERPNFQTDLGRATVDKIAERILAISIAQDQLSVSGAGERINMPNYLSAISTGIAAQAQEVAVEVNADEISLPVDRAVPLGLIVNELATNSLKHAFDGKAGSIQITLRAGRNHGGAELLVSDNGRGINDGKKKSGSGLKLIERLARGIGGSVVQESSASGTETSITFPLPD